MPTRKPGVISPWMQRSAAMDEKAVPISTERASPRRAPDTVSTTAAAAARPALMPSAKKCTPPGISTWFPPKKWIAAPGTTAQAASSPSRETVRCRMRRPIPTGIGHRLAGLEAPCARGDRLRGRGPARRNRRPRGAARAAAHARERGLHARSAPRGGRPRPAGAASGGARARGRGKALHAGGGRRGDRARASTSSTRRARALGVPMREPGERAITEEELELSRSAKALLDAGLPRRHSSSSPP